MVAFAALTERTLPFSLGCAVMNSKNRITAPVWLKLLLIFKPSFLPLLFFWGTLQFSLVRNRRDVVACSVDSSRRTVMPQVLACLRTFTF